MNHSLIITALGQDKPGIVRTLSEIVARHGGNWQESRMARLAGQFAGIVRIDGASHDIEALHQALQENPIPGLLIHAVREEHSPDSPQKTIRIQVTGNDRPGIVRELSSSIANAGGNVEDLHTGLESAPMSGHPLFTAHCLISLPEGLDPSEIVQGIENLGGDLTVDITE